jgi:hypothetical protein
MSASSLWTVDTSGSYLELMSSSSSLISSYSLSLCASFMSRDWIYSSRTFSSFVIAIYSATDIPGLPWSNASRGINVFSTKFAGSCLLYYSNAMRFSSSESTIHPDCHISSLTTSNESQNSQLCVGFESCCSAFVQLKSDFKFEKSILN